MTKIHLVVPDSHAHFQHNNERADWLSNLIIDVKPDVVVNIGDTWDFPSLSSYDRGLRSFHGKTYAKDLEAGLEFEDRVWGPVKRRKKKLPRRIFCEGNHEYRQERVLDLSPELEGTVSFKNLQLEDNYDDIVRYSGKGTPGVIDIDGITYAHYLVSGVKGLPIAGEHHAFSLVSKQHVSCTVAHSHTLDFCVRSDPHGRRIMGLVAGCYVDYQSEWAGESAKNWWSGVVICRNVENGSYDPEFVSIERLRQIYGNAPNTGEESVRNE